MRMLWRLAFTLLTGLCAAAAETPSTEEAIRNAEKAWSVALVAGDVAALSRLMGDDLTYGHASGKTDNKQTYLDRIRSGAQKYAAFRYDSPLLVRVYGGTALLNSTARVDSVTDGQPNSPHLRILHVFVKRGGQWVLVAHQSTKLPE